MSLGGYKFVGYKCARPSDYVVGDTTSETNWVLLVHKTRVKAFMDSCALSGAQWTFNHTQGQFSLGSYGNVIYRLDDVGYNYASFFKCGSSEAYYLILTAGYWDVGSSDLSAGKISLYRMLKTANNSSNNNQQLARVSCMHSISYEDFAEDVVTDFEYKKCTLLMPVGNIYCSGSGNQLYPSWNTGEQCFLTNTSNYFGYATKDKSIISFAGKDINNIQVGVTAIDGLSALSSPSDPYNIFSISLNLGSGTYGESTLTKRSSNSFQFTDHAFTTLCSNGLKYDILGIYNQYGTLTWPMSAWIVGGNQTIPYEAPVLTTSGNYDTINRPLNIDGIGTKGRTKIDLIACNVFRNSSDLFGYLATAANGNYLALDYTTHTNMSAVYVGTTYSNAIPQYYVGWDESNPDIRTEDAWSSYIGN